MQRKLFFILAMAIWAGLASAADLKTRLTEWLRAYPSNYADLTIAKIKKVDVNREQKKITIYAGFQLSTQPWRPKTVAKIKRDAQKFLAAEYPNYKVEIWANGVPLESLVPNFYRPKSERQDLSESSENREPFITNLSKPFDITQGLQGRNVALWRGHGRYFEPKTQQWRWQRPRLLEAEEEKLTTHYLLQYLLPMLENAGANVFLPHERDTQPHEVLVDNDEDNIHGSIYCENGEKLLFSTHTIGFRQPDFPMNRQQNPHKMGSSRTLQTSPSETAFVEFLPDIPADGDYAVSVSFPQTSKNVKDAHFSVFHAGGRTDFVVNQTQACGTWVYLGTFRFRQGISADSARVVLSNASNESGVVVADVVRFGGGIGNVARGDKNPQTSHFPRYLEAATYWLQWAGASPKVYADSDDKTDYSDDLASRGLWVNWLNGGSENSSSNKGLRIPIDLSLALHTDAGIRHDSIMGTLGIYSSRDKRAGKFPTGQSRTINRDLADYVTMSVTNDLRKIANPDWRMRGLWDKQYSETRRPEVPSAMLEMFSHQNFDDMQFGLDPKFQFAMCRAIYKGILRFISTQNNTKFVVQPLPVEAFSAQLFGDTVRLSWQAVADSLEPTAKPTAFVVYTRKGDGGFDNGRLVSTNSLNLPIERDQIYSFRVTAVNTGGQSFPSEILSVCRRTDAKHTVLIINGFTRISAPQSFKTDSLAGFADSLDRGVPYVRNLAYVGSQHEFRKSLPWLSDDEPGWGKSSADFDSLSIAGNTFDFPIVHGRSVAAAGFSFASCSALAIERGDVQLADYRIVDWIFGEQRLGYSNNDSTNRFEIFSPQTRRKITNFCLNGGAFLASGAHFGSELWQTDSVFAKSILKFRFINKLKLTSGSIRSVENPESIFDGSLNFCTKLNPNIYSVEAADAIQNADNKSFNAFQFSETNKSAAVATDGFYRTFICTFPIETINSENQRKALFKQILYFLTK